MRTLIATEGVCYEERETSDTKRSTERKQVIAREKYHHEMHEGHEVDFDY